MAVCRSLPCAGCGSNEPVPEAKYGAGAEDLTWPVNPRARSCAMLSLNLGQRLEDSTLSRRTMAFADGAPSFAASPLCRRDCLFAS